MMWWWFVHPPWWRRHHRRFRVVIMVGNFAVEIPPGEVVHMATTLKVGQSLPLSLRFLDQHGTPMASDPVPDSPPSWAQLDAAVESLTPSADGLTASAAALAAGTDTVRVSLSVAGTAFAATLDVTVEAVTPTQTLTSVEIVAGTPA